MPVTTSFRLERDLSLSFEALLPLLFGQQDRGSMSVLREPHIDGVIPDFLVGRWRAAPPIFPRKPLTGTETHVLSMLQQHGTLDADDLAERLFISELSARRCLRRLEAAGFVSLSAARSVTASDVGTPLLVEVTAIEMKLDRWREALDQAISYSSFADSVYVVLDGARVKPTGEIILTYREAGVGLVLQSGNVIQQICPSSVGTSFSGARLRAVQKLSVACPELGFGVSFPPPKGVEPDHLV